MQPEKSKKIESIQLSIPGRLTCFATLACASFCSQFANQFWFISSMDVWNKKRNYIKGSVVPWKSILSPRNFPLYTSLHKSFNPVFYYLGRHTVRSWLTSHLANIILLHIWICLYTRCSLWATVLIEFCIRSVSHYKSQDLYRYWWKLNFPWDTHLKWKLFTL